MAIEGKPDNKEWISVGIATAARSGSIREEDQDQTVALWMQKQIEEQYNLIIEQGQDRCDKLRRRFAELLPKYLPPDDGERSE